MAGDDRGQASVLLVGIVAIAIVLLLALVPVARAVSQKAQARAAADAAALAGAAEGEDAAREVAEDNGADLVSWRSEGDAVWVEVRVGGARAVAKARRD
jgi:secretion/DNA translocation related TadE-like protein